MKVKNLEKIKFPDFPSFKIFSISMTEIPDLETYSTTMKTLTSIEQHLIFLVEVLIFHLVGVSIG